MVGVVLLNVGAFFLFRAGVSIFQHLALLVAEVEFVSMPGLEHSADKVLAAEVDGGVAVGLSRAFLLLEVVPGVIESNPGDDEGEKPGEGVACDRVPKERE